ncbi:glycosyltransferase [Rhodocytophaga rosea]|uniref:glycosyltransferase n=1 Tax=Rhodocytophaga rosea TaxID=2704465 RepID=UPI001E65DC10|nr:glycosyltransferase [Rhodocytophaga rosea]
MVPLLKELEREYTFTFLVISDKAPEFTLKSLLFLPWTKLTEREDLLRMNIGLMPLTDDLWARGKCGFKALQYMALGIPALVSPVGVNTQIIENGKNGFICSTPEEWKEAIIRLRKDVELRAKMGIEARKKIEDTYSVQANRFTFLNLFLTA